MASNMFQPSLYSPLASEESISPLLDNAKVGPKNRGNVLRYLHWVIHAVNGVIILALSLGMLRTSQLSRERCWDMFNYYCEKSVVYDSEGVWFRY